MHGIRLRRNNFNHKSNIGIGTPSLAAHPISPPRSQFEC